MDKNNQKEKISLLIFGAACFVLALFNTFIFPQAPIFQLIKAFLLNGIFILFSLFLAVRGKDPKRFLSVKFIVIFVLLLFASQIVSSMASSLLLGDNITLMLLLELIIRFIITGAVFAVLLKTVSLDIKIFNKKSSLFLCIGLAALLVLYRLWFVTLLYGLLTAIEGEAYLSMLYSARVVGTVGDIFTLLIPTVFGISVYFGRGENQ